MLLLPGNAGAAVGTLTYESCITGDTAVGPAGSGACAAIDSASENADFSGLRLTRGLAVSGDGKSIYVAGSQDSAVARFKRRRSGELVYKDCITGQIEVGGAELAKRGDAGSGACHNIPATTNDGTDTGLEEPSELAVSADGKSLYVVSEGDDAFSRFKRNRKNGALTYKGCVSGNTDVGPAEGGGSGACSLIPTAAAGGVGSGMDGVLRAPIVTPDNRWVYVLSSGDDAISRFARNTRNGALIYRGCLTAEAETGPGGSGACEALPGMAAGGTDSGFDIPIGTAVSPDGESLYVASLADDAVVRFRVRGNGGLVHKGCIAGDIAAAGDCTLVPANAPDGDNSGLASVRGLAVSPDGRSLYVAAQGDSAVARFKRKTRNGAIAFKGCISGGADAGPVEGGGSGACELATTATDFGNSSGLDDLSDVAVTADSRSVYAIADDDDSVVRFKRNRRNGALAFKRCRSAETASGPVAGGGSGACKLIPSAGAGGQDSGLDNPFALALSPDDASLYVTGESDSAIARFTRER